MNGGNVFADTNILIALTQGKPEIIALFNGKNVFVSVITEIELLSWPNITAKEIKLLENMLSMFTIVELNRYVKAEAIKLRRKHKIKLPDALVAASAISSDIPLFTFDKGFRKVSELNLVLLDY